MVISSKTVASMSPATLRWKKNQKLTSRQNVHMLLPNAGTLLQHIYRTHLQAYIWAHNKVLHPSVPDPCELGWVKQDGRYRPILSVDPVAPEAVVELLQCSCEVSFCSRRCTWRQNNLPCTNVCKCEANEHCMNTHTHDQIEDESTQE